MLELACAGAEAHLFGQVVFAGPEGPAPRTEVRGFHGNTCTRPIERWEDLLDNKLIAVDAAGSARTRYPYAAGSVIYCVGSTRAHYPNPLPVCCGFCKNPGGGSVVQLAHHQNPLPVCFEFCYLLCGFYKNP